MPQAITEEQGIHEQWYEEAKKINTPEELAAFVTRLTTEYDHDYGTICHAIAASAIAAAWACDRSAQGGITGFQAGAIMWEFISHWTHKPGDLLALRDYDEILYPQYDDKFGTIPADFAEQLKKRAKERLAESPIAAGAVVDRWKDVAEGRFPFPVRAD